MEKIKLLEEIKLEFEELKYTDKSGLDKLIRRLKMLISKICGSDSNYLKDFNKINFFSSISYPNMPESINFKAWHSGKDKAGNLIDTIIEEFKLFPEDITMNTINKEQERTRKNKKVLTVQKSLSFMVMMTVLKTK